MLRESLKVVEAARQLKLTFRDGRTIADIKDPVELAFAIEALRSSLQSFDDATGRGHGSPQPKAKPDFATPPQMDDDGFTEDMAEASDDLGIDFVPGDEDGEEKDLEAQEEAEREQARATMVNAVSAASPILFPLRAGLKPSDIPDDAVDGVFLADDTVEQLEIGLDMIEDRLGVAVRKTGWSYRLRGLAEAAVQAIGSLDLLVDKEREETWVAMPSQSFSDLMKHVTNVSVNHDLNVTLPAPRATINRKPSAQSDLDDIGEVFDDADLSPFDAAM